MRQAAQAVQRGLRPRASGLFPGVDQAGKRWLQCGAGSHELALKPALAVTFFAQQVVQALECFYALLHGSALGDFREALVPPAMPLMPVMPLMPTMQPLGNFSEPALHGLEHQVPFLDGRAADIGAHALRA